MMSDISFPVFFEPVSRLTDDEIEKCYQEDFEWLITANPASPDYPRMLARVQQLKEARERKCA